MKSLAKLTSTSLILHLVSEKLIIGTGSVKEIIYGNSSLTRITSNDGIPFFGKIYRDIYVSDIFMFMHNVLLCCILLPDDLLRVLMCMYIF